ncbi:MAG: ADP-ribosylglycohydrolase family protein, partial [Verrucomicrobia bacterium]|nr:ADP-ribosylglycohydrolase family protein [Verrucomicrobiota bacterium]
IVTDDTLMTLCLIDIYAEVGRHVDAWDMAGPMVRRIAWEPVWIPELQREAPLIERLFYPEKWIFHRLQLAACDPRQGGVGNMVNCGAAMYIAPVGVVNACDPHAAYAEAIAFASGHQQSYGLEAAGVFAAAVAAAFVPGATVDSIVDTALSVARDGTHAAIVALTDCARALVDQGVTGPAAVQALHAAIAPFSPMGDDVQHGPHKAGVPTAAYQPSRLFSIEELPLALAFCILAKGDFAMAIEDGINSGRDTDSIGVMIGAILGAMHGQTVIDAGVAAQLDAANRLDLGSIADRFADTAQAIICADDAAARNRATARAALIGPLGAAHALLRS